MKLLKFLALSYCYYYDWEGLSNKKGLNYLRRTTKMTRKEEATKHITIFYNMFLVNIL